MAKREVIPAEGRGQRHRKFLNGFPEGVAGWVNTAQAAGWLVSVTARGHLLLVAPGRAGAVTVARTPSCPRSMKNTRAHLRGLGLDV